MFAARATHVRSLSDPLPAAASSSAALAGDGFDFDGVPVPGSSATSAMPMNSGMHFQQQPRGPATAATSGGGRAVPGLAKAMMTDRSAFLVALCFRLVITLFVMRSADVGDEWYQSAEVAYYVVFGKGELTWEWREGIRSFLYPLPFAAVYWLLQALRLDFAWTIFAAPRVIAAVTCAATDWAIFAVARRYLYPNALISHVAFGLSLTSWYTAFIGCRTLTNSVEALMLLAALLPESIHGFLFFAGLGCGMRATFVLPLLPNLFERVRAMVADAQEAAVSAPRHAQLSMPEKARLRRSAATRCLLRVGLTCVAWGVGWIAAIAAVDRIFYGRWICTPYEFLYVNVVKKYSAYFGVQPWYWYLPLIPLVLGAPTLLMLGLPNAVFVTPRAPNAAQSCRRHNVLMRLLLVTTVVLVISYSALAHKELRFLYPVVPPLILIAAACLVHSPTLWRWRLAFTQLQIVFFVGFSVCTLVLYQKGPYEVWSHVRSAPLPPTASRGPPLRHSVHVLTPCHWAPAYSNVHGVVSDMVNINCSIEIDHTIPQKPGEPPTRLLMEHVFWREFPLEFVRWAYDGVDPAESRKLAVAQRSDAKFTADPKPFQLMLRPDSEDIDIPHGEMPRLMRERVPAKGRALPDRIVIYEAQARWIEDHFLKPHGFELEARFHHAPFEIPGFDGSPYVELWQRTRQ